MHHWSPRRRPSFLRLARLLLILPLALATTGCFEATRQTVSAGGSSPEAERQARCAAWRKQTYAYPGDTLKTIDQVRVHNATGRKLNCWK